MRRFFITFTAILLVAGCKERNSETAQGKSEGGSATTGTVNHDSPLYKQVEQEILKLPDDVRAKFVDRLAKTQQAVDRLSENALKDEFIELTRTIYSTTGWQSYQALTKGGKEISRESASQLLGNFARYAAIRARVESQNLAGMKEDVYRRLFSRKSASENGMIQIEQSQFLNPIAVAWVGGAGAVASLFGMYAAVEIRGGEICPKAICADHVFEGTGAVSVVVMIAGLAVAANMHDAPEPASGDR